MGDLLDSTARQLSLASGFVIEEHSVQQSLRAFAFRWRSILTDEEKWKVTKKLVGNNPREAARMRRLLDAIADAIASDSGWSNG